MTLPLESVGRYPPTGAFIPKDGSVKPIVGLKFVVIGSCPVPAVDTLVDVGLFKKSK